MDVQSFYLTESQLENIERAKKLGSKTFWKRQFEAEATTKQKVFDGFFGVFLPAMCFLFDPVVFRGYNPLLGAFKPFAYLLSFVSSMALLAFILWGAKLKWLNGVLGGLFAVAALISFGIGIALFPFSAIGLIFIIGVLGFTPLFTGFVYWRNAVRVCKTARPLLGTKLLVNMMVLSAILSFTIPEIINVKVYQGLKTIKNGDAQTVRRTAKRLKFFAPLVNTGLLAREYNLEYSDKERKAALAEAYRELSGQDIAEQKWGLFD